MAPAPAVALAARDLLLLMRLPDASCATQYRLGVVSGETIGGGGDDVAGSALGSAVALEVAPAWYEPRDIVGDRLPTAAASAVAIPVKFFVNEFD